LLFLYFFIVHFLLVKNTYKNPYSRSPVNSFQAIAPLMGQKKGSFLRGHISLKNWTLCPLFSQTIQALSSTCVFLLGENERKLLCMGHTFTANKPLPLNNSPKQLSVSWESNPAHVKARGRKNI
jgi:hypothetical protein